MVIERGGVVGAAMDAWMIVPNWKIGKTKPKKCTLNNYMGHIDHVCQLASNADHAAIGTDLDGGFGKEQTCHDLDTIADLQKVPPLLEEKGYSEPDIEKIMHGNWLRLLRESWASV